MMYHLYEAEKELRKQSRAQNYRGRKIIFLSVRVQTCSYDRSRLMFVYIPWNHTLAGQKLLPRSCLDGYQALRLARFVIALYNFKKLPEAPIFETQFTTCRADAFVTLPDQSSNMCLGFHQTKISFRTALCPD